MCVHMYAYVGKLCADILKKAFLDETYSMVKLLYFFVRRTYRVKMRVVRSL